MARIFSASALPVNEICSAFAFAKSSIFSDSAFARSLVFSASPVAKSFNLSPSALACNLTELASPVAFFTLASAILSAITTPWSAFTISFCISAIAVSFSKVWRVSCANFSVS